MNADQLKGKWMQFKGELKQQYGKFTDDDLQADRRQLRQVCRQSSGTVWREKGRTHEVGGPVASAVSAGSHEGKDTLTGSHQEESGSLSTFHISVKEKIMKTHYLVTLCTALVVGAALIAVPATAVDISKEKTLVNDSWLTAKTKIALAADGRVKGRQIDVETTKGVVMLRGKVDSDEAKQAAGDITKMLDGVKTVKNDLKVVAPSKREAVEEKDEAITARVKEQIAKDAHLKKADIAVQTNAGVVSLTGEVKDIMTSANASWTAWFVPGVKSVKNDLTVKEKA